MSSLNTACMGGFCSRRDRCAHYHAEDRSHPIERMCERGDHDEFRHAPLSVAPPAVSAISMGQLAHLARAASFPEAA